VDCDGLATHPVNQRAVTAIQSDEWQKLQGLNHFSIFHKIKQLFYIVIKLNILTDFFDVLLTVHLSIFSSVINQLDA